MTEKTNEKKEEVALKISDVKVYTPKDTNINYHGEWLFVLGALVYGVSVRKKDYKAKITYNISQDQIHPDHFDEIKLEDAPKRIYELLLKKINADIARMDSMMFNIIQNKKVLNVYFQLGEDYLKKGADGLEDASEYTTEDAIADKKIDQMKQSNQQKMNKSPTAKKKAARKAKAKSRKNNRKK